VERDLLERTDQRILGDPVPVAPKLEGIIAPWRCASWVSPTFGRCAWGLTIAEGLRPYVHAVVCSVEPLGA
jgi:hypothetical protein